MKATILPAIALFTLVAALPLSAQEPVPTPPNPATGSETAFTEAQLLETFGWYVGRQVGISELEFGPEQVEALIRGIRQAATGAEAPHDLEVMGPQLDVYMSAKQAQYMEKMRQQSVAESAAFMAAARARPGVQVLPSGLVYEVIEPGTGDYPQPTDTVRVNYTGTLADGTVFDSSIERGRPAEFTLDQVIDGWKEGIQRINKGGKLRLFMPAELAYGDEPPPGGPIPPAAALGFEVELLDIIASAPVEEFASPIIPEAPSVPTPPAAPVVPAQ